jgi:peptide/nickel transport system ATP-binding protein
LAVGETLAIVGESGCGKSSLARALVGLVPAIGSIRLENQEVDWSNTASRHFYRRAAQIIFQQPGLSLNPRMKIGAIISRPSRLSGMADASGSEFNVAEMLARVRLPPAYADRFPHEISGGEKQRVAIARAFAVRPRVVICDEITAGLDASVQATIINLLGDLQDEFGTAYIFISHDLNLVRHFADRVAVMYLGRIVEIRRAGELLHPPYHPYTEALLSAAFPSNPAVTALPIRLQGIRPDPKHPPTGCAFHTRCPRRLGAICAIEPPPLRTITADHRFTCHIEPAILSAVPEVWQVRDAAPHYSDP